MTTKRKADAHIPAGESDLLLIRPLGTDELKGKKIMLDCGA